uniref:CAAX prenyl protease 2-like n=1 Tax=Styela clava TaxID=7725 RepID=UPI00193AAB3D|nr:CAAX prenyl protease 2-like [Styela clava]
MAKHITFQSLTAESSLLTCLSLAVLYVGSLYIWTSKLPRDHPRTIKERFRRVVFTCIVSVVLLYFVSEGSTQDFQNSATLLQWLGIRTDGILAASIFPLTLFLILFLGPLYLMLLSDFSDLHPNNWKKYFYDLRCWRNYVVAPFSEELVFRGCMLPLLLPVFGPSISIILAPSFFGVAHIHHAWEKYYKEQYPFSTVVISTVFQTFYTSLFGALSSWLFLRTGHLLSAVICHAFCNMMGFPDFSAAFHHEEKVKICAAFVCGLLFFFIFANSLTDPTIYNNHLYYITT